MRDANEELDKFNKDINTGLQVNKPHQTPPRSVATDPAPAPKPTSNLSPSDEPENTILHPEQKSPDEEDVDKQKNG